jgi:predicted phosphodiesterase
MEHKLIYRIALLLTATLMISSCTKTDDNADTANQRFLQSMQWNNSHSYKEISVSDDNYFMLAAGDIHVGGTKNLDSIFKVGVTTKASAIVMAGDLTTGQSADYAEFEKHLPGNDIMPTFLIAGNHDLFHQGWSDFRNRFGSSSYLFTVKTPIATDLYICLETGGGTLGDKQLDWLRNILETERSDYRHCVVFTHNNFFRTRHTDSTNPPVEELEVLLQLFTLHKVEMVITGHDHMKDLVEFCNTKYIIMDALKDGVSNAGYFRIGVENGKIMYEFKNL